MSKNKNMFEFKRQLAHILYGVLILWGIHFNWLNIKILGVLIFILYYLLKQIKKGYKVPIFYKILHFFEREKHLKRYPGRGLFFFTLGAFFTILFFNKTIALAALSILLLGDAATNVCGRHLGKTPNPLNKNKTIEGTLAGILVSFLVCCLFFTPFPSLITSIVAMIVEVPKVTIKNIPIDDNLTIPLSAGFCLYCLV